MLQKRRALRAALPIPVVGTVPAIKPAAALTASGVIGLLATSATVCRPYTDRLIADFAAHRTVVRVAADPLVAQAERLLATGSVDEAVVEAALAPLWEPPALDTVVLGCTHFPLLRAHFPAPRPVTWVDSGAAIARRVDQVLGAPRWATTPPATAWATDADRAGLAAACQAFGFPPPRSLVV